MTGMSQRQLIQGAGRCIHTTKKNFSLHWKNLSGCVYSAYRTTEGWICVLRPAAWDGLVIKKDKNEQLPVTVRETQDCLDREWVRETIESAGNLIKIFFRSAVMAKGCPTNVSPTPMLSTSRGIKQYEDKLGHWFANHFNHSNQAF